MSTVTNHKIHYADARNMESLKSGSVDLVVTSPPYPMIEMWDKVFCSQSKIADAALKKSDGHKAFELMHKELDKVWRECHRVLRAGGIACINIGDAVRTLDGEFRLYANHARVLSGCRDVGFSALPAIIWRKQTNAPNKFMGSGMLPVGAYVTLEHEYILVFKKGGKRAFTSAVEKEVRQRSSFFWEERNKWFSDIWFDVKGTGQKLTDKETRERSAAFPLEIPYRLINMYSVQGATVLDPFLGIGTTTLAAMITQRNSVGVEIVKELDKAIGRTLEQATDIARATLNNRLNAHSAFVQDRVMAGKELKYSNPRYNFPVMTRSEQFIDFGTIADIKKKKDSYEVSYA